MMKSLLAASAAAIIAMSLPAFAEGDAAKGEKTFKKCKSCHMIKAPDDKILVKGGKAGPNLYGIIGRTAGSVEDARYSKPMQAAGEAGLVWDEENLAVFVADPKAFLTEVTGDSGARSNMSLKLRKGGEDVAAYLAGFSDSADSSLAE